MDPQSNSEAQRAIYYLAQRAGALVAAVASHGPVSAGIVREIVNNRRALEIAAMAVQDELPGSVEQAPGRYSCAVCGSRYLMASRLPAGAGLHCDRCEHTTYPATITTVSKNETLG